MPNTSHNLGITINVTGSYKQQLTAFQKRIQNLQAQVTQFNQTMATSASQTGNIDNNMKKANNATQNLNNTMSQGSQTANQYTNANKKVQGSVADTSKQIQGATTANQNWLSSYTDSLGVAIRSTVLWAGATTAIYGTKRALESAAETISEVEEEMVGLERVMDEFTTNFEELQDAAANFAVDYATSMQDVVAGMREWGRQGREQLEVLDLTEASLAATNVSTLDAGNAVEYLTAAILQFNKPATEAMSVVDSWNHVANNFATTAVDLAQSVAEAGAAANAASVSMDELLGMTTALTATTAKSGSRIGNALRTIFSRMQGRGQEGAEALGLVEEQLNNVDIALRINQDTYRDTTQVLTDVADKWHELTEVQRSNIAFAMGGRRRYSDVIALLENWDMALEATEASMNALGSAMRENEQYMESLGAQAQQMRSTIEATAVVFGDAGFRDTLVSAANSIQNFFESMQDIIYVFQRIKEESTEAEREFFKLNATLGALTKVVWTIGAALTAKLAAFVAIVRTISKATSAYADHQRALEDAEQAQSDFNTALEDSHRLSEAQIGGIRQQIEEYRELADTIKELDLEDAFQPTRFDWLDNLSLAWNRLFSDGDDIEFLNLEEVVQASMPDIDNIYQEILESAEDVTDIEERRVALNLAILRHTREVEKSLDNTATVIRDDIEGSMDNIMDELQQADRTNRLIDRYLELADATKLTAEESQEMTTIYQELRDANSELMTGTEDFEDKIRNLQERMNEGLDMDISNLESSLEDGIKQVETNIIDIENTLESITIPSQFEDAFREIGSVQALEHLGDIMNTVGDDYDLLRQEMEAIGDFENLIEIIDTTSLSFEDLDAVIQDAVRFLDLEEALEDNEELLEDLVAWLEEVREGLDVSAESAVFLSSMEDMESGVNDFIDAIDDLINEFDRIPAEFAVSLERLDRFDYRFLDDLDEGLEFMEARVGIFEDRVNSYIDLWEELQLLPLDFEGIEDIPGDPMSYIETFLPDDSAWADISEQQREKITESYLSAIEEGMGDASELEYALEQIIEEAFTEFDTENAKLALERAVQDIYDIPVDDMDIGAGAAFSHEMSLEEVERLLEDIRAIDMGILDEDDFEHDIRLLEHSEESLIAMLDVLREIEGIGELTGVLGDAIDIDERELAFILDDMEGIPAILDESVSASQALDREMAIIGLKMDELLFGQDFMRFADGDVDFDFGEDDIDASISTLEAYEENLDDVLLQMRYLDHFDPDVDIDEETFEKVRAILEEINEEIAEMMVLKEANNIISDINSNFNETLNDIAQMESDIQGAKGELEELKALQETSPEVYAELVDRGAFEELLEKQGEYIDYLKEELKQMRIDIARENAMSILNDELEYTQELIDGINVSDMLSVSDIKDTMELVQEELSRVAGIDITTFDIDFDIEGITPDEISEVMDILHEELDLTEEELEELFDLMEERLSDIAQSWSNAFTDGVASGIAMISAEDLDLNELQEIGIALMSGVTEVLADEEALAQMTETLDQILGDFYPKGFFDQLNSRTAQAVIGGLQTAFDPNQPAITGILEGAGALISSAIPGMTAEMGAGIGNAIGQIGEMLFGGIQGEEMMQEAERLNESLDEAYGTLQSFGMEFGYTEATIKDTANALQSLFGGEDWDVSGFDEAERSLERMQDLVSLLESAMSDVGNGLRDSIINATNYADMRQSFRETVGQALIDTVVESFMQQAVIEDRLQQLSADIVSSAQGNLEDIDYSSIGREIETIMGESEGLLEVLEEIRNATGVDVDQRRSQTFQAGETTAVTYHNRFTVQAGAFMGNKAEAKEFAKMLAPYINSEISWREGN